MEEIKNSSNKYTKNEIENNSNRSEINLLINTLVNVYFGQKRMLNNEQGLNKLKSVFINMLEAQESKNPHNSELNDELKQVINYFDNLMRDDYVRNRIISGAITKQDFINQFINQMTRENTRLENRKNTSLENRENRESGDNKRKINDMSRLYNSDSIIKSEVWPPRTREKVVNHYKDKNNNPIDIISNLGSIKYTEGNGLNSECRIYKIERPQMNKDENRDDFCYVYTNIKLGYMNKKSYRDAVLEVLLSPENISQANCRGYIGEIKREPLSKENIQSSEKIDESGYSYRINDEYVLVYDAAAVTASINLPVKQFFSITLYKNNRKRTNEANMRDAR